MKKLTLLTCLIYLAGCGSDGGRKGAPIIGLNAAAISFTSISCGSNPESQTFEIANAGKRTLLWSVSNLPPWLVLTPDGGTAPSTVTAQVNAADLACGQTYSQTFEIVADGASNTPVSFTVTLTIPASAPPPSPAIGVTANTLTFTASICGGVATSAAPSFDVVNTGTGTFNWGATDDQSWIQFAPLSGSAGTVVTVEDIDTSNLPCGQTSTGTIQISSEEVENSPVGVTVQVVVPSAASITPSTTGLGFFAIACKANPDPLEFTIQNVGQTPLGWSAALTYTDGAGWASVDVTGGSVAAGATSGAITVTVDPSGLTCGQGYAATLTLTGTSGGNNVTSIEPKTVQIGFSNPIAWRHQNPKSTSYPINDVAFSEEGVAWAVGGGGIILRSPPDSPDYGNNWIPVVSGTAEILHAIHFVNSSEGWIVGDNGAILHSSNGGATWVIETGDPDPITQHLQSVYFLNASHGWAVGDGGTIAYRGSDGKWIKKASGVNTQFTRIFMNDAEHGWITASDPNEPLFWTNSNWTGSQNPSIPPLIPQDPKTARELYSVFFLSKDLDSPFPDRLEGWAVGENGSILHIYSDTGLDPWTTEMVASGTTFKLFDLFMSNSNLGWAVGGDEGDFPALPGTILRWNGSTWSPVSFNVGDATLPAPKVFITVASSGVKGVAGGISGMVSTSSNGTDWENASGPSVNNLTAVGFASDGVNGWAVGAAGTILTTSNGGASWVKEVGVGGDFTGLSIVSGTNAWAVTNTRGIYHHNNGSWGLNTTLAGSGNLKGVHFVDANNGWAVGRISSGSPATNKQVYYYNGTSWNQQTFCNTSVTLNSVYFMDALIGWVAGSNGVIARTTDGGGSWTCSVVSSPAATWNSIYFIDASTGWAVGSSGRIARTVNGGLNWVVTQPVGSTLFDIGFSNASNGWIVGASGTVLYTQNGGSDWAAQPSVGTNQSLNGVYFTPGGLEGWAVGNTGVLLHTVSGGEN